MFSLAAPYFLYLIPLPWLIWFLAPKAKLSLSSALRVPFFENLLHISAIQKSQSQDPRRQSLWFLIWLLLLFALSGPQWIGNPQPLERKGYNIFLVLDISGSMDLQDMRLQGYPVSRLTAVKEAANQFIQDRTGDKIGLILFGTRAYLQTPLTYDHLNIQARLEDATVGLAGQTTSLGDALGMGVKKLQNTPKAGRIIILLTDGANNSGVLSPLKSAELARDEGIKVYTIGLGSEADPNTIKGLFLAMGGGADLDEGTLKKIAQKTGGHYFRATNLNALKNIYSTINQFEPISQEQENYRPRYAYYFWPLAFALILFFLALAWKPRALYFRRANND